MSFTTDQQGKIQCNDDSMETLCDHVLICNLHLSLGKCWIPYVGDGERSNDDMLYLSNNTLTIESGNDTICSLNIVKLIRRDSQRNVTITLNKAFKLQLDASKPLILWLNDHKGNTENSFTYSFDVE